MLGYVPATVLKILQQQGMTLEEAKAATANTVRQRLVNPKWETPRQDAPEIFIPRQSDSSGQALESSGLPTWAWVAGGLAVVGLAVYFGRR